MDLYDPNWFPNRKPTATERFLGVPSHAPPFLRNPTAATDELHEDDVLFFSTDYYAESNRHHHNSSSSIPSSSSSSSSTTTPIHHHSFGILAALPENETSPNLRSVSQVCHKASSSSSSSSARIIPSIPRPRPQDRFSTALSSSSVKYHQSAPVNVPILSEAMMKVRRRHREFDEVNDEDGEEEEEEEMLPPHEIAARNSEQSPMLACSVLEGVGRTLKGRDLRQVRNAVLRQTGFID